MVRVPQQDRSSITRDRVLDAAVGVLLDLGYPNTTAAIVADRAGVSRGALQYHFPTKRELLAAAVEHLAASIGRDLRRATEQMPAHREDRTSAVVDLLWAASSGPLAVAWMELTMAARTDPELRDLVRDVERRVMPAVRRQALDLFGADPDDDAAAAWVDLSLILLTGLNVTRGTGAQRTRRHEAEILATWKSLAPLVLAQRTEVSAYSAR